MVLDPSDYLDRVQMVQGLFLSPGGSGGMPLRPVAVGSRPTGSTVVHRVGGWYVVDKWPSPCHGYLVANLDVVDPGYLESKGLV